MRLPAGVQWVQLFRERGRLCQSHVPERRQLCRRGQQVHVRVPGRVYRQILRDRAHGGPGKDRDYKLNIEACCRLSRWKFEVPVLEYRWQGSRANKSLPVQFFHMTEIYNDVVFSITLFKYPFKTQKP